MRQIDNRDDRIDSRDVLTRIAELESDLELANEDPHPSDHADAKELDLLVKLVSGLRQAALSGDTPEDGIFLVRENYFVDYIKEMSMDCMDPDKRQLMEDLPWSCIDWSAVAEECRPDYSIIEFDGVTYYYR